MNKRTIILLTVSGSRAYGTHSASSDLDMKGVALPFPDELLDLKDFEQFQNVKDLAHFFTEEERANGYEGVVYSLKKFLHLALQANPNILDALFCRDSDVRKTKPFGLLLRDMRQAFLSKRAFHTFGT